MHRDTFMNSPICIVYLFIIYIVFCESIQAPREENIKAQISFLCIKYHFYLGTGSGAFHWVIDDLNSFPLLVTKVIIDNKQYF